MAMRRKVHRSAARSGPVQRSRWSRRTRRSFWLTVLPLVWIEFAILTGPLAALQTTSQPPKAVARAGAAPGVVGWLACGGDRARACWDAHVRFFARSASVLLP